MVRRKNHIHPNICSNLIKNNTLASAQVAFISSIYLRMRGHETVFMPITFSFNIILLQSITISLKMHLFMTIMTFNVFLPRFASTPSVSTIAPSLASTTLLVLARTSLTHIMQSQISYKFLHSIRLHIHHYRPNSPLVHYCYISPKYIPRGKQLIIHSPFSVSTIETTCVFHLLQCVNSVWWHRCVNNEVIN